MYVQILAKYAKICEDFGRFLGGGFLKWIIMEDENSARIYENLPHSSTFCAHLRKSAQEVFPDGSAPMVSNPAGSHFHHA
jgi:hypothetical protein